MEHCSLCGYVCIRRVDLFCCSLAACRTCAVTKLVSTPTCWNKNCGKPANTFDLVAANSSSKDDTVNLVAVFADNQNKMVKTSNLDAKMDKTSNPDAKTGFIFGGFLKTVIPSKDYNVKSSALSAEPSSSSQVNSLKLRSPIKGHSLPSLKEKLQEHNKKSVPVKRCGPTKKSELTSSLTKVKSEQLKLCSVVHDALQRVSQFDEVRPSSSNCSQMLETCEPVLNQVADPNVSRTEAATSNPLGISSEGLPSETSQWNAELLNCDVCKAICKRAVMVPCCKSQACNGCAVLKVIGDRKCWGCSEALRSKDLVNHKYLRIAVEMFKKNGNIDANILAALARKQTCENKDAVSSENIQDGQEMVSEPNLQAVLAQKQTCENKDVVSSENIQDGQEMVSEPVSEDIKREHDQLASVCDPPSAPPPPGEEEYWAALGEEDYWAAQVTRPVTASPSVVKPKDIIAKETNNFAFESTAIRETSEIVEATDEQRRPIPKQNLIEEHLKTRHAVKSKKFSFGWTQSMMKTPFGSPFLKKHGMYSKSTNSLGEGNRINRDKCKSGKQSIEMSSKVILTSPPPNIIERNVRLEYPVDQSTLAGQSITGERDEDIFSSESSISRVSTRRDSGSSCLSKYGSSLPGSAEESASGTFSSTSRKSYTRGNMSRNSIVGIGRKSKSPCSNSTRKIKSSSNDKSRRRSPIRKGNGSPWSTSPGIDRRWRSRSPSIQYGRSGSPGIGRGRRTRSPSVQYARRSRSRGKDRSPSVQYAKKSRSPGIGHSRIKSGGIGHGRSRSPSVRYARRSRRSSIGHRSPSIQCGRRSRSPSIGHGRSRSPSIGHGRSRSPSVQYARRSRSSSIGHGRTRSQGIRHERSRSPSVQYASRSRRSSIGRRRTRSPSIQYGRRSRCPSIGHGRSRSPSVRYARRSRSSSIGHGSRSRSSSFSFGNRSSSPSINIGSRSRCNLWRRSQSPSIHPQRRSRSSSIDSEGRRNSLITVHRSIGQSGELGRRRSKSPSIKRNSKESKSNNSSRSSSISWTEVQLGRNLNFRHDHKQFNNESLDNRNPSLVASYSSEDESNNPQKFVDSQKKVETEIDYWEKIKRLKTDQERLWLAKNEFENPVCSDPRTNLTYHGYKRKKVSMLEDEDVDAFYEFFTNPDIVRLKEVKPERRQKFYIKEGKVLPMPGYIQKGELRHVNDVVSTEGASREVIDANELKMLIEKEFYQKFQTTPQNGNSRAHKRSKKPLVAHFKAGHEEAMEFLKFYKSEFNRGQVEEVIYLEKMYKSFSLHYGKVKPLYCKTCKFAHAF